MLAMLQDSYREITGHSMPNGMTLEEGQAAVREAPQTTWPCGSTCPVLWLGTAAPLQAHAARTIPASAVAPTHRRIVAAPVETLEE